MRSTNSHRRVVLGPLTVSGTDWQAVDLGLLGTSGILVNAVYRLDAGGTGTGTGMEVKVVCGAYDPATITSAQIAAIPDENVVYSEGSISLTADDTDGETTNISTSVGDAAVYDRRGGVGYSNEDRTVMLVLKGDGTLDGSVYVCLSAKDTGR